MSTGDAGLPLRADDVLASVGTGLWRWDNAAGTVDLDCRAAGLLGLPERAGTVAITAVRARVRPEDFVDLSAAVSLGLAERTVAEARMRVAGVGGEVVRLLHTRLAWVPPENGDPPSVMAGTLVEVARPGHLLRMPEGERRAREAFLLDAGRALAEATGTSEVLRVAASLSMPGFAPQGQAVFGVEGDRLRLIGQHGYVRDVEQPFLTLPLETHYPASVVARSGRAVYLPSPESYRRRFPAFWPLVEPLGRSSWAFLPLVANGRTTAVWLASFRGPVEFSPDERSVLTTIARMLAQALSRAHLQESERALSTGLQRSMMPTYRREIGGLTLAARYVPTGGGLEVGGDWYDVIDLPSGRTALVIGDVQGHDVRAAGLMGQLRIALRAYAAEGHRPDAVLSRASRFLAGLSASDGPEGTGETGGGSPGTPGPGTPDDGTPDGVTGVDLVDQRFATCLYLEVDPGTGRMEIARAGHPDPAVRLNDGTAIVRRTPGGPPLGVVPDSDYPTSTLALDTGEVLLICTDGLIETGGHDLDSGWLRLAGVLREGPADDLEALADALITAVHGPASHHTAGHLADRREDDVALMLLRRGETAGDGPLLPPRRTVLTIGQDEPRQVRGARDEVRTLLHDWADLTRVDIAVLLVSEVATNVLVHTEGDAVMSVEVVDDEGGRRLRVEVSDGSDEMPHRRHPGEMASSGRGLVLIERLADAWGVDPRGRGKAIWFELRETPRPRG